ncbi:MAG: CPBP family intramembrane metalloprotease [Defluviitaleaceae bacterium]|nr:CPBP family intramembrane metalloprotease [Defluviitaleaceae bacterium]
MKKNEGSKFMLFMMIWAIITVFMLTFVLGTLSLVFDVDMDEALEVLSTPLGVIFYQVAAFIFPLVIWMIIRSEPFKPNFPAAKLGGKNIIIIVALSFLLQPIMMLISGITSLFFNNDVAELMYTFQQYPFWLQLIAIAVTPAICEELVFRGYIQSKYNSHTIKKAALINGLFFAMMHLNLQQFAYTFVLGVVFAYMVHYTRSIWAAILPHFILNGTQAVLGRWAFVAAPAYVDTYAEELFTSLPVSDEIMGIIIIGIISLILSPVIFILFREFFKHNKWQVASEYDQAITPKQQIYEHDKNYMPEWARTHYETPTGPQPVSGAYDATAPQPMHQHMPQSRFSQIDMYTVGVVVIFILFAVLTILS